MHVTVKTCSEGATLFEGNTLTLVSACNMIRRYACARSDTYHDGGVVPVVPLDGAPDLRGGERLTWDKPHLGCAHEAVAAKPLTRQDFDRLERKVDELTARFEKMLTDNASRLVTGDAKGTATVDGFDMGQVSEVFRRLAGIKSVSGAA